MLKSLKSRIIFVSLIVIITVVAVVSGNLTKLVMSEEEIADTSFQTIYEYAVMAADSYNNVDEIISKYSDKYRVQVKDLAKYQGRYFVLFDDTRKIQYISIRGTNNSVNAIEDGKYIKTKDKKTGIYIHEGFWQSATETYNSVVKDIKKDYTTYITGHSLGGAEAAILHLFLLEDGYNITRTITFGQPKFTNEEGMKKYENINLLRVIDEKDLVPLVPPFTLASDIHGMYRHIGREIILLDNFYYCYLDKHVGENPVASGFWDSLIKGEAVVKDHYMKYYLQRIEAKLDKSVAVPYQNREKYLDK